MNPRTFSAALLSTARVAGCVALIGCGPKTPTTTPDGGVVAGESTPAMAEPAEPIAVIGDTPPPTTTKDAGECSAYVTERLGDWDPSGMGAPPDGWETPEGLACCQVLAEAADADGSWDFELRHPCCSALGWLGSNACTPWGPPRPPAMTQVT